MHRGPRTRDCLCRSIVASLALLAGQSAFANADESAPPGAAVKPAVPSKAGKSTADAEGPLSDDAIREWTRSLEHAIRVNDVDGANDLIDWDALLAVATALPENSPELARFRTGFIQGFKSATCSKKNGFARSTSAAIEDGGSYRFLRTREIDGRTRALFRMVNSDGALNYHDYVLGRTDGGRVRAVDCYIMILGEMFSQNARRSFLPFAQKNVRGGVGQLSQSEQDYVAHFNEFIAVARFVAEKKYRLALQAYKSLPPSLRGDKTALVLRFNAAQSVSDAEYLAAIDDFRKRFPNDPQIDLVSIDAFIIRKDFARAAECIERLSRSLGGDPYLSVLKAGILLKQNKVGPARSLAEQAVKEDPSLVNGYYLLLEITLREHRFQETVALLDTLGSKFNVRFNSIETVAAFAEFAKSPEYKSWIAAQTKKK